MKISLKSLSVMTLTIITMFLIIGVGSVSAENFFGLFGKHIRGSGDLETEGRNINEFDRIKLTGSFDLFVEVGEETSLEIKFDDNLIELVETEVRGRTLYIGASESFSSRKGCKIRITTPELEQIKISGSGDVEVYNCSGKLMEFLISGSGDIRAEGRIDELELAISGSGDIDTRRLKANEVYAKISGSGDIKAFAKESFTGRVSGSGDIVYYGDPEHISTKVRGSGNIRSR